jgi:hypothetical protein
MAANGGDGIVVGVCGVFRGARVVGGTLVACSASRIRRIFTSGDSARVERGDEV